MRRTLIALTMIAVLTALVGAALAQGTPAPKPAGPPAPAPPGPPTDVTPGPRSESPRPAPCILPTLRLINPQMMPTLAAKLNLTDDQKTKVLDLLTKTDKDLKPKIENQIKLAHDYVAVLVNVSATQAELIAAGEKAMKAETDVLTAKIQALFALKGLLTPDQNKLLAGYLDQFAVPWRERPALPAPPAPAK